MSNPFIPKNNANVAILDARASNIIVNNLEKLNIKVVRTIKCKELDESVQFHPDMVMHPIASNTVIVAPNVFDYYDEHLSKLGIIVLKGEKVISSKYPFDIAYNVGRLDNVAVHNFKHTDEKLMYYLKKENVELINVKQGYSKCSLAIVDESSGITSDVIIFNKLTKMGYDMLLIEPGSIKLENQKYGFIGGASGNYSKDELFFSGKLISHPNSFEIKKFIEEKNKKIIYLSDDEIVDLGTIITLNNC